MFVRTKSHCERMLILLGLFGVRVGQLHGGLSQSQRVEALAAFKRQELDVLICTDLAARGLDIEGVQTVGNKVCMQAIRASTSRYRSSILICRTHSNPTCIALAVQRAPAALAARFRLSAKTSASCSRRFSSSIKRARLKYALCRQVCACTWLKIQHTCSIF